MAALSGATRDFIGPVSHGLRRHRHLRASTATAPLLDFDYHEVKIAQAIIAHSRQVFLAADHTKFGRNAMGQPRQPQPDPRPVHGSGAAGEVDATDVPIVIASVSADFQRQAVAAASGFLLYASPRFHG